MKFDAGIKLELHEEVYPPSEDTLLLLEAVEVKPGERVLEIGTGTGIIALHAAKVADVVATDISPFAVELARRNAKENGLSVSVVRCDMFQGLRGDFDTIMFNPPYLREMIGRSWRERSWQGGRAGDAVALRFLEEVTEHVRPGGRVYMLLRGDMKRVLNWAYERFRVRELAEKPLFFERLLVLQLEVEANRSKKD